MIPDKRIPGEQLARLARFGSVHLVDRTRSTNDLAFSLAGSRQPTVVIARVQTHGRGRFRRRWYSDDDSLTLSWLLFFPPEEQQVAGWVTQLAGLAVCRAIEDVAGLEPVVRWPNDVIVNRRKVAGILCEMRRDAMAVGIGLNVNQQEFPENPELGEAGSLRQATGRAWQKLDLAEGILRHLWSGIEAVRTSDTADILTAIKDRSGVLHRRVEVRTRFRRHIGTVVDLDAEGRIVLRTSDGRIVNVNSGQVRRLR